MRLFLISFFSCKLAINQAGKEGTIVTSSKVRERLIKETDNNVTRESLVY
jgi:predicted membrane GTPase involved in stress response